MDDKNENLVISEPLFKEAEDVFFTDEIKDNIKDDPYVNLKTCFKIVREEYDSEEPNVVKITDMINKMVADLRLIVLTVEDRNIVKVKLLPSLLLVKQTLDDHHGF